MEGGRWRVSVVLGIKGVSLGGYSFVVYFIEEMGWVWNRKDGL